MPALIVFICAASDYASDDSGEYWKKDEDVHIELFFEI